MEITAVYRTNIDMAKELIYVADDFGMSDEINDAIHCMHASFRSINR